MNLSIGSKTLGKECFEWTKRMKLVSNSNQKYETEKIGNKLHQMLFDKVEKVLKKTGG